MKSFGRFNPIVQVAYFLSLMLVTMFLQNPIFLLCSLTGAALFCILTQEKVFPFGWIKALDLGFYLPFFLLITITNPLFSHKGVTPLFFMNGNPITLEALAFGAALATAFVSVMLWGRAYSRFMTTDRYLYIFGRFSAKLSLVLSMALRYVPLLKRRTRAVSRAQKAVGLYSSDSYFDRVRSGLAVTSSVIGWSLENAVETSHSMQARCYGKGKRTSYSDFRFTLRDGILISLCALFLLLTLLGAATGAVDFSYYPRIDKIETEPLALISYISFALLALLPSATELLEGIRWKFYESKI